MDGLPVPLVAMKKLLKFNAQNALLMQFWIRNWINGLAAVKKPRSNQ